MCSARPGDRIKVLFWDGSGIVMIYKRLEQGSFSWPKVGDGVMRYKSPCLRPPNSPLIWTTFRLRCVRRLQPCRPRSQAKVTGLETRTEGQDYLIAELRHALYGKRSEPLPPDERQLVFDDLQTAVTEAEVGACQIFCV
ncbi:MAG: IS66 family insertion sequence element accessory protein TnpB [Paracoccus sp. (in: a-proteobacteria)]|uniref:IS66 family insertion sequence element accessory protein TnpB n=1 Tax=Paracoccus sp. TaxID=267 RepID=UPI0039E6E163